MVLVTLQGHVALGGGSEADQGLAVATACRDLLVRNGHFYGNLHSWMIILCKLLPCEERHRATPPLYQK